MPGLGTKKARVDASKWIRFVGHAAQVLSVGNHGRHSFETEPLWLQRNRIRARTREHLRRYPSIEEYRGMFSAMPGTPFLKRVS